MRRPWCLPPHQLVLTSPTVSKRLLDMSDLAIRSGELQSGVSAQLHRMPQGITSPHPLTSAKPSPRPPIPRASTGAAPILGLGVKLPDSAVIGRALRP